jgi:hypothetical protein
VSLFDACFAWLAGAQFQLAFPTSLACPSMPPPPAAAGLEITQDGARFLHDWVSPP